MSGLRVLIVDDHPLFAQGTAEIVGRLPGIESVGFALDLDQAVDLIRTQQPNVVLCDILFGDQPTGFDLPRRLEAEGCSVPVLFLTQFGSAAMAEIARTAGGVGVLSKSSTATDLQESIVAAHEGRPITHARSPEQTGPRQPGAREVEVMKLVATGMSTSQVAAILGISDRTVDTHLSRLYERYKCSNRTQLVLLAERQGWIDDELAAWRPEPPGRPH